MTIWILTILVLGSTVGLGYRQGVIRATFSFFGILFAALLAVPIGKLLKPLLLHFSYHNQTQAWMLAPLVAFPLVLIAFKIAGAKFHLQAEVHHKHKVSELELSIWSRLNHRLGACVGVLNGTVYLILLAFVIFNFSYWSVQVADSETEAFSTRLVNRLGEDEQSTGFAKVGAAVATLPPDYYRLGDLAGFLRQNPAVTPRLERYPLMVSLLQRDDIRVLSTDSDFTNAWATHAPMSQILANASVQDMLKNNDLLNTIWGIFQPNLDDFTNYLGTGKSPKFDAEPVLGFWDFNVRVSFAYTRLNMPEKVGAAEVAGARNWMYQAYSQTELIAAGDGQAFMKFWPDSKTQVQPGQPLPTVDWRGTWSKNGANYDFSFPAADNRTFTATLKGPRLMLSDGKSTFVFDKEP